MRHAAPAQPVTQPHSQPEARAMRAFLRLRCGPPCRRYTSTAKSPTACRHSPGDDLNRPLVAYFHPVLACLGPLYRVFGSVLGYVAGDQDGSTGRARGAARTQVKVKGEDVAGSTSMKGEGQRPGQRRKGSGGTPLRPYSLAGSATGLPPKTKTQKKP